MSDDIRKSQITGTFGVGSLRVQLGGLSMIAAGLDHWYQDYVSHMVDKAVIDSWDVKEPNHMVTGVEIERMLDNALDYYGIEMSLPIK